MIRYAILILSFLASAAQANLCDSKEAAIFDCSLSSKKYTHVSLCKSNDASAALTFKIKTTTVPLILPRTAKDAKFGFGKHVQPAGQYEAVGLGSDGFDVTLIKVEENEDLKKTTTIFEFVVTELISGQTEETQCGQVSVDKIKDISGKLTPVPYYDLLAGLSPKAKEKDDEASVNAALAQDKDQKLLEQCCKNFAQLHPANAGSLLDGSYQHDSKDHAFFMQWKGAKANWPASWKTFNFAKQKNRDSGVGVIVYSPQGQIWVIKGFEDFGFAKDFDLDAFDVIRKKNVPTSWGCVGDAIQWEAKESFKKKYSLCVAANKNWIFKETSE